MKRNSLFNRLFSGKGVKYIVYFDSGKSVIIGKYQFDLLIENHLANQAVINGNSSKDPHFGLIKIGKITHIIQI